MTDQASILARPNRVRNLLRLRRTGRRRRQPVPPALDNVFTFAGRTWDNDANLYYNRARWYDPNTARFLSEDPIGFGGGDANLYRYASNDPANLRDPSGLSWITKWGREADDYVNEELGGWGTVAIIVAAIATAQYYEIPITVSAVGSGSAIAVSASAEVPRGSAPNVPSGSSSSGGSGGSGGAGGGSPGLSAPTGGSGGAQENWDDLVTEDDFRFFIPDPFAAGPASWNSAAGSNGVYSLSDMYIPPEILLALQPTTRHPSSGVGAASAQAAAPTDAPAQEGIAETTARVVWDSVKLWDNNSVATDYNNLLAAGYGSVGAVYGAVGNAVGQLAGVSDLADAFEGRNQAGQPLSLGQRVWAGTTGTFKLVTSTTGIYKLANAGWTGLFWRQGPQKTGDVLDRLQEANRQFNKNKDFRNWAHKEFMEDMKMGNAGRKNPDLPDSMIADAFEEWLELGKPKR